MKKFVDVSLTPTITWEALNNIDGLFIFIETEEGDNKIGCEIELPKDATSYTIPTGILLQPNTEYELTLQTETTDGRDNDLSTRVVYFTTGSE